MTPSGGSNSDVRKLLSGAAIKIWVALLSTLVLVLGAWLSPRAAQPPVMPPPEHAAPLFEEQVQLRQTSRPFVGVQDVAASAKEYTVAIPRRSVGSTLTANDFSETASDLFGIAGFGVFVSDTHVLTHLGALDGHSSVELSRGGVGSIAEVIAYDPASRLVLLQTTPLGGAIPRIAVDPLAAGALAVGVGRSAGSEIAAPVFIAAVSGEHYAIGAADGAILPGMPVFTLDGDLFAIAAPEGGQVRAILVREVLDRLIVRAALEERRSSFGLAFQTLDGDLTRAFGDKGIVTTHVVEGGPADLAGIQVGDVVTDLDETPLDSLENATKVLTSAEVGTVTRWRLRRGRRALSIDVTPAPVYQVAALAYASEAPPAGPEARVVLPAAVLEAAAIPGSARVLSVNGRPVGSRVQVQRELRLARTAVPVLLQEGQNRFFVSVEPDR